MKQADTEGGQRKIISCFVCVHTHTHMGLKASALEGAMKADKTQTETLEFF